MKLRHEVNLCFSALLIAGGDVFAASSIGREPRGSHAK